MKHLKSTTSLQIAALCMLLCALYSLQAVGQTYQVPVLETDEPMATGPFSPTWESLRQYQVPEWFRDAKFGIWAHWGPQCVEGSGDWMARELYMEGNGKYNYHVAHYGHPSEVGFKDILPLFRAEHWTPEELVRFYKEEVGAEYFFALGNHHDNFDLIYFDVTVLPFYPMSDAGLKITTHMYNHSAALHGGKNQAVVFGKILEEDQKSALVWDVERGAPNEILQRPWQCCNCLGDWHYNTSVYERNGYKSAATVAKLLVDIVSKNGNMLLSVPLRADGTPDEKELAILHEFGAWMKINKESIVKTRPWTIFGEGPIANADIKINNQGFNDGQYTRAGSDEIRFTQTEHYLYVCALAWPNDHTITVRALAEGSQYFPGKISKVELLGYGKVQFRRTPDALVVTLPEQQLNNIMPVLKIKI